MMGLSTYVLILASWLWLSKLVQKQNSSPDKFTLILWLGCKTSPRAMKPKAGAEHYRYAAVNDELMEQNIRGTIILADVMLALSSLVENENALPTCLMFVV